MFSEEERPGLRNYIFVKSHVTFGDKWIALVCSADVAFEVYLVIVTTIR